MVGLVPRRACRPGERPSGDCLPHVPPPRPGILERSAGLPTPGSVETTRDVYFACAPSGAPATVS